MGLLDDAIREHLELKRLRGADPGQVAREEQEALGPIDRGESRHSEGQTAASAGIGTEADPCPPAEPSETKDQTGQETTELDMSTVLGEHGASQGSRSGTEASGSDPAHSEPAEDSLEWEVPREQPHGAGQEPEAPLPSGEESVEDVLKETPDFLRETPEQERLWFEQRPPRDFDFDK